MLIAILIGALIVFAFFCGLFFVYWKDIDEKFNQTRE